MKNIVRFFILFIQDYSKIIFQLTTQPELFICSTV
jgi:hypothetical protein